MNKRQRLDCSIGVECNLLIIQYNESPLECILRMLFEEWNCNPNSIDFELFVKQSEIYKTWLLRNPMYMYSIEKKPRMEAFYLYIGCTPC